MQNSPATSARDIQEALKILRFRLRRNVSFRPVIQPGEAPRYSVDGKLRTESEILRMAEQVRMPDARRGLAS